TGCGSQRLCCIPKRDQRPLSFEADEGFCYSSPCRSDGWLSEFDLYSCAADRNQPLCVYGPNGAQGYDLAHIIQAYRKDIAMRLNGLEQANKEGYKVRCLLEFPTFGRIRFGDPR